MADKIFCGSGKKKEFPNGGSITTVTLDMDTLERYYDEYGFTTEAGKRTLKIKVSNKRDGADQYGKTHNVEIDTWKPDGNFSDQGSTNNNFQSQGNNSYNSTAKDVNAGNNKSNSKFGTYQGGNSNQGGNGNFEEDIPF